MTPPDEPDFRLVVQAEARSTGGSGQAEARSAGGSGQAEARSAGGTGGRSRGQVEKYFLRGSSALAYMGTSPGSKVGGSSDSWGRPRRASVKMPRHCMTVLLQISPRIYPSTADLATS